MAAHGACVALPFTFLPVLLVARDEHYMGRYANGVLANVLDWAFLAVVVVIGPSAVPLLILTDMGKG
jgi:manganese transport protein